MNWDWLNKLMTDPRFYGSMAHAMGGFSIVLVIAFLTNSLKWTGLAWSLLIVLTAIKEFYYDTHFEIPVQDVPGGMRDFLSYQFGTSVALLISYLKLDLFK